MDETFYFAADSMRAGDRLRYMDGAWHFENGTIKLEIKKIVIDGETVVSGKEVLPYSTFIIDGTVINHNFSEKGYEHLAPTIIEMLKLVSC